MPNKQAVMTVSYIPLLWNKVVYKLISGSSVHHLRDPHGHFADQHHHFCLRGVRHRPNLPRLLRRIRACPYRPISARAHPFGHLSGDACEFMLKQLPQT